MVVSTGDHGSVSVEGRGAAHDGVDGDRAGLQVKQGGHGDSELAGASGATSTLVAVVVAGVGSTSVNAGVSRHVGVECESTVAIAVVVS